MILFEIFGPIIRPFPQFNFDWQNFLSSKSNKKSHFSRPVIAILVITYQFFAVAQVLYNIIRKIWTRAVYFLTTLGIVRRSECTRQQLDLFRILFCQSGPSNKTRPPPRWPSVVLQTPPSFTDKPKKFFSETTWTPQKSKFWKFGGLDPPLVQKIGFWGRFCHFPSLRTTSELRYGSETWEMAKTEPKTRFFDPGVGPNPPNLQNFDFGGGSRWSRKNLPSAKWARAVQRN